MLIRNRRVIFVLASVLVFTNSTLGFYFLERVHQPNLSVADAFWWSIVTMTTVGYGDMVPRSDLTKIYVGYPTILLGVVFFGYILSDISTWFFERNRNVRKGLNRMRKKEHIIIIRYVGESRVSSILDEIAKDNSSQNIDIVIIDDTLDEVDPSLGVAFVRGDPASTATLQRANIKEAKSVLIFRKEQSASMHEPDLSNIATVLAIRELNSSIPIITECSDIKYIHLLRKAGSTRTVCLEEMREQIIVQELLDPGVFSILYEITSNVVGNQIYIIKAQPQMQKYADVKNFFAHQEGTCLLGIRRAERNFIAPTSSLALMEGDSIICIAKERPIL